MMEKSVENSKLLDKFFEIGLEHKFLDQTPYELLTWDDCINTLNEYFVEDKWIRLFPDFSFVANNVTNYPQVQSILNHLKKINPNKAYNANLYCNMSTTGSTFGLHVDTQDVWVWQCVGTTKWAVHYNNGSYHSYEGVVVHELKPGNMLYIPKGLYHAAKPLTPRFSISFAVFDDVIK